MVPENKDETIGDSDSDSDGDGIAMIMVNNLEEAWESYGLPASAFLPINPNVATSTLLHIEAVKKVRIIITNDGEGNPLCATIPLDYQPKSKMGVVK